jgi:hypothetical protein
MGCFDCDGLQFHYSEGCDACIDHSSTLFRGAIVSACDQRGALIYGKET